MKHQYKPKGVCSVRFDAEINDEGIIESLSVKDGCNGYGKGMGRLVQGRHMDEIIERLNGVTCGKKPTSCPDQFAKMLAEIRDKAKK